MKSYSIFSEFCYSDSNSKQKKKLTTNFDVYFSKYIRTSYSNKSIDSIQYKFKLNNGTEHDVVIPLSEIQAMHSHKYTPIDCLLTGISQKDYDNLFLCNAIKYTSNMKPFKLISCQQGYNRLNDKVVLCIGNRTINKSDEDAIVNRSEVKLRKFKYHKNNLDYIIKLIESNVFPPVLLLSTISAFTKRLVESKGNGNYGYTNYVYGNTSCGKTFITTLYIDIFENSDNIASLSSEKRGIKQLSAFSDIPIGVDDLCKSSSSRDKNTREAKLADFIQLNQGAGNSMYKGINAKMNNIAFVSGEYVLDNPSTINRCLLIHMDNETDPDEIAYLKSNHDKYMSFLQDFLEWVCRNYDELKTKTLNVLNLYVIPKDKSSNEYLGWYRIMRTKQILNVSMFLFKTFLYDLHGLCDNDIAKLEKRFENSIEYCISDTLDHVRITDDGCDMSFVDVIIQNILYCQGECIVTTSLKNFGKGISKYKSCGIMPKQIFYYDGAYLCVYGNILVRWLKQAVGLEQIPTKQRVSAQLKKHNLLLYVGGDASIPLQSKRQYKHKLYHISLQHLIGLDRLYQLRTYDSIQNENYDLPWAEDYKGGSEQYGYWTNNDTEDDYKYD